MKKANTSTKENSRKKICKRARKLLKNLPKEVEDLWIEFTSRPILPEPSEFLDRMADTILAAKT